MVSTILPKLYRKTSNGTIYFWEAVVNKNENGDITIINFDNK